MTTSMNLAKLVLKARKKLPLLAIPAVLALSPGRADAVLTYNIFESGPDVVFQASGTLVLPSSPIDTGGGCAPGGAIFGSQAVMCLDTNNAINDADYYRITGPIEFNGFGPQNLFGSNLAGLSTLLFAGIPNPYFGIDEAYASGDPIAFTMNFPGESLNSLGITSSGLIGTWFLTGEGYTANDQIQLFVGPPQTSSVPGPLPLLGTSAAFAWSRKLRRRVASSSGFSHKG
jgi:hypothetical protein